MHRHPGRRQQETRGRVAPRGGTSARRRAWCGFIYVPSLALVAFLGVSSAAEAAVFNYFPAPYDVSPGLTGWRDVDVSAYVPVGATGVILQYVETSGVDRDYGVRMKGSTDAFYPGAAKSDFQGFMMTGLDANRVFQVYSNNVSVVTYLVGYTMPGVTFFTNRIDESTATTGSFVDVSIAADTGADTAIGAIFHVQNTSGSSVNYGVRKKGSTDNRVYGLRADNANVVIIGVDATETAQQQIASTAVDLYLVGYVTSGAVFFTNGVNKTTAGATYADADITPNIGGNNANGAFVEIYNDSGNRRNTAVRPNGATYDYYNLMQHQFALVGVDLAHVYEQKQESSNEMHFYLVGYSLGDTSVCCSLGTTEVAGSTITVTGANQFELRFNRATGGGIDQFYDLAEDPGRANDLAGGTSRITTLFDQGISDGGTFYDPDENTAGAKLDLLEATPTRVKVRQEAFYQEELGSLILPGVKSLGDYTIYPPGRLALRLTRKTTAPVPYVDEQLALVVHVDTVAPFNTWTAYGNTGTSFPQAAFNTFFLLKNEVSGARTDFLSVISKNWSSPPYYAQADRTDWQPDTTEKWGIAVWEESTGATLPAPPAAGSSETFDFLTYFKPTNFASNVDTAVTSRVADYRTPATPTINLGKGSQWQDVDENTGTAGDFYNESEAAYEFNLDASTGLDLNLDGSTTTRYSPFFKIRQWRSAVAPPTITVDGVARSRNVDYRSDVKPVTSAVFADSILWHSTLEDATALTGTPDIGSAGHVGASTTIYQTARYGAGLQILSNNDWFSFTTASGFDKAAGAVEFWFQPTWPSYDGIRHDIGGFYLNAGNQFLIQKLTDDTLRFTIVTTGGTSDLVVAPTAYSWRAYDWVNIIISWDDSLSLANQQRLYINGLEPAHTDPTVDYNSALLTPDTDFYLGNISNIGSGAYADGIFDEVYSYSLSARDPSSGILAHGGLTTNPLEFLASPSNNATLSLNVVNGTRQGEYLYIGSDSRFRGLNVVLATAGAGTANLQWQFWNGTAWANLEAVTGFTDTTSNLTRNGNVFWTADPPGWSPSSSAGGPDLYYVRAYVASGSYTTNPVESRITTDVLLFQYCRDVSTNANFVFGPVTATAVELMSFSATGADAAVDLTWVTGSELDNLGFNLYRGLSDAGPWTRITSSLIPGLGSSPLGATYTWRDAGLVNGMRYYYRLEDLDTRSVSAFHGPVSAVPQAAVAAGGGSGESGGSSAGGTGTGSTGTEGAGSGIVVASGSGAVDGLPWCPTSGDSSGSSPQTGVASSSASASSTPPSSPSSPYPCVERYGDPGAVSVRVLSRTLKSAEVELRTGGFYAIHDSSGGVRLSVPGFEERGGGDAVRGPSPGGGGVPRDGGELGWHRGPDEAGSGASGIGGGSVGGASSGRELSGGDQASVPGAGSPELGRGLG
jgi:hypothetical protein